MFNNEIRDEWGRSVNLSVQSRAATRHDVPFLLALRRETMDVHLQAVGIEVSEPKRLQRVMYRFDCAAVLLNEGAPVGLLKLVRGALEWEVLQLQIAPSLQGRGVGAAVLQAVLCDASARRLGVRLGVLKSNPAQRLYQRLGFVRVGETEHEYLMLRAV